MLSRTWFRCGGGLLLVGLLAAVAGCGPNYKNRAVVKGKVTYAGKPLTIGSVMFYGKDNMTGQASIEKDGTYVINDAPVGDVKITIFVPKPPPGGLSQMRAGQAIAGGKDAKSVDPEGSGKSISIMGALPDNIVPIPDRYGNEETSGLNYTVKKGEQTHDIVLPR